MEESAAIVFAFLERLLADRAAGIERDLGAYQALFPGHEGLIAREHARIGEARERCGESDAEPLAAQRRIGPYVLRERLGRGGQGEVFLADDTRLARPVALKLLNAGAAENLVLRERFRREALVASRLDHPGICTVYEAGEAGGALYVAMRYLQGRTLAQEIAANKRDARAADRNEVLRRVALIEAAARALHAAHEAGVVHRDVKPSNLMLAADASSGSGVAGGVVVLDFGLAGDLRTDGATMTASGALLGTPAYMSPEQLATRAGRVDRRTDVYSLAVTLFELVALEKAFDAPTREGLFHAILTEPPPSLRRRVPSAPRDLDFALATAMEKDRDQRYESALAFAEDLRAVIESRPIAARRPSLVARAARFARREPAKAALGIGLSLALLGAAGLGGFLAARLPELREGRRAIQAQEIESVVLAGLRQHQLPGSIPEIERILREKPELDLLRLAAIMGCLEHQGDERGLALAAGAVTADGKAASARLLAALLRQLGRAGEAAELDAGFQEPIGPLEHFARGYLASREGRVEDALKDFTEAVLRSPSAEPLLHTRRALLLFETGRAEEALAAAQTLELLFPRSAIAWFFAGTIHGGLHDSARAREAFRHAVEIEPQLADAWVSLGISNIILGDPDAGLAAFERALAIDTPDAWRISGHIGVTLQLAGRPADALEPLQRALAENPDLLPERRALGEALLALERFEAAAVELRRVVAALPNDAQAAASLARAEAGHSGLE